MRRYPALAFVVAAGALALLLPTALNVPQSGPTTLAEFAPVPGAGKGSSDISELGQAGSGGLGFGSGTGTGGRLPEQTALGKPSQTKAKLKRCVGSPPRQTEDLLSPPCVAFFEGDNGGSTAKGVTGDEVTAVAVIEAAPTTDQQQGQIFDCASPHQSSDQFQDTLCKSYFKYFNDRYQTYNRSVHLWSSHGASVAQADASRKPFAVTERGNPGGAERKIMGFGYIGSTRKSYQVTAPYKVTYRADTEDQTRMGVSYICQKLQARPTQYTDDPTLKGLTRKFGLWWDNSATKDLLLNDLKAQCGIEIPPEHRIEAVGNPQIAIPAVARFKNDSVTSVIIHLGNTSHALATQYATDAGYFPEWVLPGINDPRGIDTNFYGRVAVQAQWTNAFGINFDYRRDAIKDQTWVRAFKEGCSGCADPPTGASSYGSFAYDQLNMLFYGIQAAGPRLTPENIDKGLHAIPPNGSPDPYKPAAYFSPGNYSFLKDAMAIWWDPSGIAPGSSSTGCYKLPYDGRRFRANEWLPGDADVKRPGPCQGDISQT